MKETEENRIKFYYKGSVLYFNKVIKSDFETFTMAKTEKQARANIVYQFKKKFGYTKTSRITIPDTIVKVSNT